MSTPALPRIFAILVLTALLGGCGVPGSIDRIADMIDDAADRVLLAGDGWKAVAENLPHELERAGQTTLRMEVDAIVQRAIKAVSVEYMCSADFTKRRLVDALKRLAARKRGQNPPPPLPAVCTPQPESVDLTVSQERRQNVMWYGYDFFDSSCVQQSRNPGLKLWKVEHSGERIDVSDHIYLSSPYLLIVNTSDTGISLSRATKALELWWNEQFLSAVPITHSPREWTESVSLKVETYVPPSTPKSWTETRTRRIGSSKHGGETESYKITLTSDNDFKGHGPCVTTWVEIRVHDQRFIQSRIFMDAYECHSDMREHRDFTRAQGTRDWQTIHPFPEGTEIVQLVLAETREEVPYFPTTPGRPETKYGRSFVRYFRIFGDEGGDEAGTRTCVQVHYGTVTVKLREVVR